MADRQRLYSRNAPNSLVTLSCAGQTRQKSTYDSQANGHRIPSNKRHRFQHHVSLLARGEIDYFADSLLLETGKQEDPEADEATA